jgi:hypothetical protein
MTRIKESLEAITTLAGYNKWPVTVNGLPDGVDSAGFLCELGYASKESVSSMSPFDARGSRKRKRALSTSEAQEEN